MSEYFAKVGPDDTGVRLDRFLGQAIGALSRTRARALISAGAVYEIYGTVETVQTNPRAGIKPGRIYKVVLPEPVAENPQAETITLDILFEDAHFILVNKPAGMAVHPAPGSRSGTLVNALLHHYQGTLSTIGGSERPGIVHRIDKNTTGVLAVAKTDSAHRALGLLFAKHDIDRTYLALTRGAPRPMTGMITTGIGRNDRDRKKMAVMPPGEGRQAVTRYKVVKTCGQIGKNDIRPAAALIACRLQTGRTHQIRLHMAHLGTPLIGDPVYGRRQGIKASGNGADFDAAIQAARQFTRQALHAHSLGFVHPFNGKRIFAKAPIPDDLARLITAFEGL